MEVNNVTMMSKESGIVPEFLSRFNKTEESSKLNQNDDGWGGHGGYMKAKNRKLDEQFDGTRNKKSDIFHGVSIWVNGYTIPSSDELRKLICDHGGKYQHFFSKTNVTHIIATNLPDSKIKNLKKNDKVVHPDWITQSVKSGRLLCLDKYLLYSATKRDGTKINFDLKRNKLTKIPGDRAVEIGNNSQSLTACDFHESHHDIENTEIPDLLKHEYNARSNASKLPVKAGDENYIEEFYAHSRLHHLSMWRAELKRYATLIQEKWKSQKESSVDEVNCEKVIMHIDMDAFFVSVAVKINPDLKGKPVAVCHSGRNNTSRDSSDSWSEIASCSYEARDFGLHNGMFLKNARKLCPQLICVPYNFDEYRLVSQKFYEILSGFTCEIEAVSCDEALLDLSKLVNSNEDVLNLAEDIRQQIFLATQCHASCGIGCNILIARLATKCAKPNGKCYITRNQVSDFMSSQKVKDLPGVGHIMSKKLDALGISCCTDLQQWLLPSLQKEFGNKFGEMLYKFARGIDERKVKIVHERRSVSAVINYGMRFTKHAEVEKFVKELSCEVEKRLKDIGKKGRLVTVKIMVRQTGASTSPSKYMGHGICDSLSRSCSLPSPTDNPVIIGETCIKVLNALKIPAEDYRGIGIQISKLTNADDDSSSKSNLIQFMKPVSSEELFERDRCIRVAKSTSKSSVSSPKKITIDRFMNVPSHTSGENDSIGSMDELEYPRLPSMNDNLYGNREECNERVPFRANKSSQNTCNSFANWDPNVLEELPDYIRQELLSFQSSVAVRKDNHIPVKIAVGKSPSSKSKNAKKSNYEFVRKSPTRRGRGRPRKLKESFEVGKYGTKKIDEHLAQKGYLRQSLSDQDAACVLNNPMRNGILYEMEGDSSNAITAQSKHDRNGSSGNDINHMLLSPSQMDQSVLQALPKHIRDDVIKDAKKLKRQRLSSINNLGIENIVSDTLVCHPPRRNFSNKDFNEDGASEKQQSPLDIKKTGITNDLGYIETSNVLEEASINSVKMVQSVVDQDSGEMFALTGKEAIKSKVVSSCENILSDSDHYKSNNSPANLSSFDSINVISLPKTAIDDSHKQSKNETGLELLSTTNNFIFGLDSKDQKLKEQSNIICSPSQIDQAILDVLPSSIQNEVMIAAKAEKERRLKIMEAKSEWQITHSYISDKENSHSSSKQMKIKVKHNMPMLYGFCNSNDVKKLLRNWVKDYDEPLLEDVEEVIRYFRELLSSRNMETLFGLMLFLRRITSSHSAWYASFNEILQSVQNEMKSVYSGTFPISKFIVDLS